MALVSGGRARMGETLYVPMPAGPIAVTVTKPIFYDEKASDARYLGARIKPMLEMRPLDSGRGPAK